MAVKNGNPQFHRMTEHLFRDLDCAGSLVKDINVSSAIPEMTDDELIEVHFVGLCRVLDVLRKHPLTCNAAKAVLFATELKLTG